MSDKAAAVAEELLADAILKEVISEEEGKVKKKKKPATVVVPVGGKPEDIVDSILSDTLKTAKQKLAMKMMKELFSEEGEKEKGGEKVETVSPRDILEWVIVLDILEARKSKRAYEEMMPPPPPWWMMPPQQQQQQTQQQKQEQTQTNNVQQMFLDMMKKYYESQLDWYKKLLERKETEKVGKEDILTRMLEYQMVMSLIDKMARKAPEMKEIMETIKKSLVEDLGKEIKKVRTRMRNLEQTIQYEREEQFRKALVRTLKKLASKTKELEKALKEKKEEKTVVEKLREIKELKKEFDSIFKEYGAEGAEETVIRTIARIFKEMGISDAVKEIVLKLFTRQTPSKKVEEAIPPPPTRERKVQEKTVKIEIPKPVKEEKEEKPKEAFIPTPYPAKEIKQEKAEEKKEEFRVIETPEKKEEKGKEIVEEAGKHAAEYVK